MSNNQASVIEMVRVICKEKPMLADKLQRAVDDLMYEGFHVETIGSVHRAFLEIMHPRPKMTQREREEQQRFLDEAAGM